MTAGKARQGPGKAGKGRRGCYSPARLHNALAKLAPHLKVLRACQARNRYNLGITEFRAVVGVM